MRSQLVDPLQVARRRPRSIVDWAAAGLLVLAALLVGVAILSESTLGRALNGVGAVIWVAAAALLAWRLRAEPRAGLLAAVAVLASVVLAAVVRPDSLFAAIIGFGVAGAVVGLLATRHAVSWAMLVPAIYLPAHVVLAIARSMMAGAPRVRIEPPPTAAIVPLVMVLAAALAALAVSRLRSRGR